MSLYTSLLIAGLMAGLSTASALAAGGGGGGGGVGGGGEMPSASAPRYDPAEEYAKAVKALQARDYKTAARAAGNVTTVMLASAVLSISA